MWVLVTSRGQRIAVRQLPAVLGSARDADVVVPHGSVAERHAQLTEQDGDLVVEAIDEAPLAVDGLPVTGARLASGDDLVVGRIGFTVERHAAGAAPAAETGPVGAARSGEGRPSGRPASRPGGRAQPAAPTRAVLEHRQRGLLVSKKREREGWIHTDLSSLSTGARLAIVLLALALAAGLLWGIQWAVASAL